MFVSPGARGQRLGRRLLAHLEAIAIARDATLLLLETAVKQPQAIALYRVAGYRDIAPFGEYRPDPLSVFMKKSIGR